MGAIEAIAMIGTSYVLISLYRMLSHIERRYRAVWHGPKKSRQNRVGKPRAKRAKIAAVLARKRRKQSSR